MEIFAPAEGGKSFGGLDTINRYRIDPALGVYGMTSGISCSLLTARGWQSSRLTIWGIVSVEAPDFLKACDDVREGRDTKEARFFLWSDRTDSPPPGSYRGDTFFMVRPTHPPRFNFRHLYESAKHEFWQYSDRAKRFYSDQVGRYGPCWQ